MNEFNKKLLEWTGVENIIAIDNGDMLWEDKEGTYFYLEYFTDSLDSCFNRLVPKLDGYMLSDVGTEHHAIVYLFPKREEATADSLALALCLAIEKLIDKEKK